MHARDGGASSPSSRRGVNEGEEAAVDDNDEVVDGIDMDDNEALEVIFGFGFN